MSTEADELAKTILGIKLRHVVMVSAGCCALLASIAGGVAAYEQLGWPVPASREYVAQEIKPLADAMDDLAGFARQSRKLILSDKWWRLQEKLEEVREALDEAPHNRMLRDQSRRLKRDQEAVQAQIDQLDARVN